LHRHKLIDDRTFAGQWIYDRTKYKPKSRLLIQRELLQKGIDPQTVNEITHDIDDEENAFLAGRKKADQQKSLPYGEFYKKMASFLGRRGFSADVVHMTVIKLWSSVNKHDNLT
jgi:regulatory protein